MWQVEGGFLQGMGWTCIEELVWGDKQHKWVKPGVLHTRGPGTTNLPPLQPLLFDLSTGKNRGSLRDDKWMCGRVRKTLGKWSPETRHF